jgi:hypothetical protein
MANLRVGTVFGESPDPELQPGRKKEKKMDPEAVGLVRGIILVTGVFLSLALTLVWLKYFPSTPDLPAIPDTGEFQQLSSADEAKLNNYSWVNQKSGIVRIPIKEAMSIVEERGLPARQSERSQALSEGSEQPQIGETSVLSSTGEKTLPENVEVKPSPTNE